MHSRAENYIKLEKSVAHMNPPPRIPLGLLDMFEGEN